MANKVSTIICTFNSGEKTKDAILSVLNQNYDDFECIVVDGASTDHVTLDIIKSFEGNHHFKYISEPDSGIFNAMNKGWKLATGEWIHYLGSDDQLLPDGIINAFSEVEDSKRYDILYGNILYKYEDGTIKTHHHKDHRSLPMMMFACHQAILMRKNIIERLGGFDENIKLLGDKDLMIRTYYLGNCRYKPVEAKIALFAGGGASSNYYNSFKEEFKIIKKIHPGIKYCLYVLQHYPRMWLRKKLRLKV